MVYGAVKCCCESFRGRHKLWKPCVIVPLLAGAWGIAVLAQQVALDAGDGDGFTNSSSTPSVDGLQQGAVCVVNHNCTPIFWGAFFAAFFVLWVWFLYWNEEPPCCQRQASIELPEPHAPPRRAQEDIQARQTQRLLAQARQAEAENKRLRAQAEAQSRERALNERLLAESVAAAATAPIERAKPDVTVVMAQAASVGAATPAEATIGSVAAVDQSVPYHAPVIAPAPAPAPAPASGTEIENLSAALKQAKLQQYEAALRELGCAMASDLEALEESDMVEIGMKKYEIKRLQRVTFQGASGGSE